MLIEWNRSRQSLLNIRRQYSPSAYNLPPQFKEEITGESLFNKYQPYLSKFLPKKNLNQGQNEHE